MTIFNFPDSPVSACQEVAQPVSVCQADAACPAGETSLYRADAQWASACESPSQIESAWR